MGYSGWWWGVSTIEIKLASDSSQTDIRLMRRSTQDAVVEAVSLLLSSLNQTSRLDVWRRLTEGATAAGWEVPQ